MNAKKFSKLTVTMTEKEATALTSFLLKAHAADWDKIPGMLSSYTDVAKDLWNCLAHPLEEKE